MYEDIPRIAIYLEKLSPCKNFRAGMWSNFKDEEEPEVGNIEGLVQGHNAND